MHRLHRHARGLLVALVAITLSAGVALAARPSSVPPAAASDGLQTASDATGKNVPVTVDVPDAPDQAEDQAEAENEASSPSEGEATDQAPSAERKQNHGWFVSEAAKGDTPAEFANHGAYVSSVAKGADGKPPAPEAPAAATTGQQRAAAAKAAAAEKKASHTNHGH